MVMKIEYIHIAVNCAEIIWYLQTCLILIHLSLLFTTNLCVCFNIFSAIDFKVVMTVCFLQVLTQSKSPLLAIQVPFPKWISFLCWIFILMLYYSLLLVVNYLIISFWAMQRAYSNFETNKSTKSMFCTFLNFAFRSGVRKMLMYSVVYRSVVMHLGSE